MFKNFSKYSFLIIFGLAFLLFSLIPESNATYLARSAKNAKLDFYGKL